MAWRLPQQEILHQRTGQHHRPDADEQAQRQVLPDRPGDRLPTRPQLDDPRKIKG
jgi:hypothetical protein